jgi:dipeptidyl aminopeptidase/acylaminoacyl peptidase
MKGCFLLSLLIPISLLAQQELIKPYANLVTDGIPDIPVSVKQELQRYSESRSASFADWHPKKNQMLISTRFGSVAQLHSVSMPLGARKQLTFFEDAVSDASYEPVSGNYFLFTKDLGGNEFGQIYRYDIATGGVTLLTDGGRSQNGGIRWRKNGKEIIFGSTMRNGADRDIYIMDPLEPSSRKLLIENKGGGWSVADWSPDGSQLLMMDYRSANESHYWIADVKTGIKKPVTDTSIHGVSLGQARFNKDGSGLFFETDADSEFKRLAFMNLRTSKVKYLSNIPWDVESFDLSQDGKTIVFVTNEEGLSKLYQLNTATGFVKEIKCLSAGVYGSPSLHSNGRLMAITVNAHHSPADIYVIDLLSSKAVRWTESEMGGLVSSSLAQPKLIRWKSFDDRNVSGFYYPAPSSFKGKRPVIINIHGGPEGQSRPVFLGGTNYFINELGIAMIFPNVRGSSGFGKSFLAMDNGFNREHSVRDIGSLLSWIEKQPELDASRVMVTGGSYGGYMTLAVLTNYADAIKCGIDVVGISNFNTFLKNTENYRRDLRRVEYGDERDPAMFKFLEEISPLNNAEKIKSPLFIVQGGNDPRVPRTEAEQMASKVKAQGGVVWYLEAKDEGHGFRKKANADYQRWATVMFIRKYLLEQAK